MVGCAIVRCGLVGYCVGWGLYIRKGEMMAKLNLKIRAEWIPFNTDLSRCQVCDEVIYSKMMVMCTTPFSDNRQWISKESELKVCMPCFDLIESK